MRFADLSLVKPGQTTNLPKVNLNQTPNTLGKVLSLTFIIIGAMSLMLLVIAGFRYVISGGDPTKIADAKRAIIYTFVGIVVSASAYIIVQAVIGQASQGG